LNQRGGYGQRRARKRTRAIELALIASCIDHILEYRLAAVADCDIQRAGNLQLPLPFVALIAVTAVRSAHKGLGLALETGEQILTASVAGIHQRKQLILTLTQFRSNGFA